MIRPTGQIYYYYTDHLGTPRMLVNSAGTTVWKASYTPFGATTITTSTVENNIRFPDNTMMSRRAFITTGTDTTIRVQEDTSPLIR